MCDYKFSQCTRDHEIRACVTPSTVAVLSKKHQLHCLVPALGSFAAAANVIYNLATTRATRSRNQSRLHHLRAAESLSTSRPRLERDIAKEPHALAIRTVAANYVDHKHRLVHRNGGSALTLWCPYVCMPARVHASLFARDSTLCYERG
jgi:hypothetical protein